MAAFGQPSQNNNNQAGGSAPSSGLFGTGNTGTTNVFGGGTFGVNPSSGSASGGGTTSGPQSAFGGGGGSSIFGGGAKPSTPGPAAGGVFGTPSNTTPLAPSGGLFGNNGNSTAAGNAPPGGTFGNNSSAPASSGGNLFGNANRSNTPAGGGIFGTTNNAPAPSAGIFGNTSNTTTSTAAPATGSTFSSIPTAPSTPASGTGGSTNSNPLFGGGLFGSLKPAESTASAASKPTGSTFFSQSATNTSNTAPAAPAGGGLFGPPKPADNTSTPAGAPAGGNLFGGGGLFGKSPAPQSSGGTAAAPPSLPAFNLGGTKDALGSKDSAQPKDTASSAPLTFFANKPGEKKDAPGSGLPTFNLVPPKDGGGSAEKKDSVAPQSASAFSLGGSTAPKTSSNTAASGTAAASATVSVPPPSMLRGKTIEEVVNRWSGELEMHVREFDKFAGEVAVWDRALIENGNNLAALYAHVLAAEREQNDVDQSLDHIEQQQKDLAATLEAYEKSTEEILGGQGGSLRALDTGPADTERDKNYILATELHGHLDDLSGSLTQMIDAVNALAIPAAPADREDAMGQISQILSSHLESLVWIDGAVREVEGKITDVERRVRASGESGQGAAKARGFAFARD